MRNLTFLLINHGKIEFRTPYLESTMTHPIIVSIDYKDVRRSITDYITEREISESKDLERAIEVRLDCMISNLKHFCQESKSEGVEISHDKEE